MVGQVRTITRRITNLAENAPYYYSLILDGAAGWLLLGIEVFLRGSITLSGGTTSGTLADEDPGGLFQTIQVDATAKPDGMYRGGKIKNLSPRSILRGNIFDRGRYQDDLGGAGVIDGSAATTNLKLRLPLWFALPKAFNPIETALRLDQFSQILLTFQMSSVAHMRTGNDRTVSLSSAYIEVVEHREYNPNYYPLGTLFEDEIRKTIPAANARFTIDQELSKSETYYDALLMTESTSANTLVDTVLNRSTWFQASEQFEDRYADNIRCGNEDELLDAATSLTGLYHYDFAEGRIAGCVPWLNGILDVSNPGGANADNLRLRTRRFANRVKEPTRA